MCMTSSVHALMPWQHAPGDERGAGMRTQAEARAHYITIFRRELCIVVTREFARHRLRRRCFIGVPRGPTCRTATMTVDAASTPTLHGQGSTASTTSTAIRPWDRQWWRCGPRRAAHGGTRATVGVSERSDGHAADMAAIFIDEGSHNGYCQIEKRQQITARGSERGLGNCKTAQAVDPVIRGPHASPVERQTARLNSH